MKILIIDDHTYIQQDIQEILKNHTTYTATTIKQAHQQNKKHKPHIILLDINLPDSKDLTPIKTLKKQNPNVNIIMLTIDDNTQTIIQAIKNGAHDYITKPYTEETLTHRINTTTQHIHHQQKIKKLQNILNKIQNPPTQ